MIPSAIWLMLLVALVALVVFMAIPAMAAEPCSCPGGHCALCCDGNHLESDGWKKLDTQTNGSFTNGGKYYIDADVLEKSFVISKTNYEITICLNGKQWIGAASGDERTRPLSVTKTTTVNIVDCSPVNGEGVSAGRITGSDLTWRTKNNNMSRGGNLYAIDGGVIKIYNGTMEGGKAFSGGNVYIGGTTTGSKLYVYGGVLKGGEAISYTQETTSEGTTTQTQREGCGGNIFMATSSCEVYLHGGKVAGGFVETTTGTALTAKGPAIYVYAGTCG